MEHRQIQKHIHPRRIIWPILLGLVVVGFMFMKGFNREAFAAIEWTWKSSFWIFMALVMMAFRQLGYMYRIRILTDNKLSWGKSFDVIALWEFSSALTPSVIGGSAVALYFLHKENISMGKTTTIVLFTTVLDELFFILLAPLCVLIAGTYHIFPNDPACLHELKLDFVQNPNELIYVFLGGYAVLFVYTLIVSYGLFINPRGLKRFIIRLFSVPVLRKWRTKAVWTGNDVMIASRELQEKGYKFWLKTFGATVMSWSARFLIINCIILAFTSMDNNFIVFSRQFVMFIIMMIPSTPGASGVAEFTFLAILCEYLPAGLSTSFAFLWRILTYYPYLLVGVLVAPRWIKRVYHIDEVKEEKNESAN